MPTFTFTGGGLNPYSIDYINAEYFLQGNKSKGKRRIYETSYLNTQGWLDLLNSSTYGLLDKYNITSIESLSNNTQCLIDIWFTDVGKIFLENMHENLLDQLCLSDNFPQFVEQRTDLLSRDFFIDKIFLSNNYCNYIVDNSNNIDKYNVYLDNESLLNKTLSTENLLFDKMILNSKWRDNFLNSYNGLKCINNNIIPDKYVGDFITILNSNQDWINGTNGWNMSGGYYDPPTGKYCCKYLFEIQANNWAKAIVTCTDVYGGTYTEKDEKQWYVKPFSGGCKNLIFVYAFGPSSASYRSDVCYLKLTNSDKILLQTDGNSYVTIGPSSSAASPTYNFKYMLINGTIIGDNKIYYAQSTKNTSAATVKLIYFGIKS